MTRAFATSYDDMAFTPPQLGTIRARTLIVHGDRDPYCTHGPVFGPMAPAFTAAALAHLSGQPGG